MCIYIYIYTHTHSHTYIYTYIWEWHENPLQYSCLENPHGQRSLPGYTPWVLKESDTIEWLSTALDSTNIKIKYMWMFHILDKGTSRRSKQKVQTVGVQSYPTLCDPLNYSPRGFSVHEVFQVRTWKEFIISYSRRSSQTRDWNRTHVSCDSCIGRWIIYHCTTWEYSFKSNLQSLWWFKHENI